MDGQLPIDRRTVLRLAGGAVAFGALGGQTAAADDESGSEPGSRPSIDLFEIDAIREFEGEVTWEVSDPDGDLGRVRLQLLPREGVPQRKVVDEVTVDVSGREAAGVTTLVDREESRIARYDVRLDVFREDGDEFVRGSRTNVVVEFDDDTPDPVLDRFDLEPIDDRTVAVDWEVTDPGADLESLRFEMITADDEGLVVDRIHVDLSGETGSGRTLLLDTADSATDEYSVQATLFTGNSSRTGRRNGQVTLQSEGEDDDDEGDDDWETGPAIDRFDVTDRSNNQWARFDVDWAASHPDGELATVTSELLSLSGDVLDSETTTTDGAEAAGSHSLQSREALVANEVRLSVVDTDGIETEETTGV